MWRMKKSIRMHIMHHHSHHQGCSKHVLKNPSSPNFLIVPLHADLRRGNIFLVPLLPSASGGTMRKLEEE
ncbi:hypothetical protein HN873_013617 [Arachis hypogaea]